MPGSLRPVKFSIDDKAVRRKLKALEPKVRKKYMRPALRAGGQPVLKTARANAPKLSGKLRKSIKLRAGKRSRRGAHVITQLLSTNDKDTLFAGKTFYGAFREFGWKLGKRFGGKKTLRKVSQRLKLGDRWITLKAGKKVQGEHFIERAYLTQGKQSLGIIMQKLAAGVESAAKEG